MVLYFQIHNSSAAGKLIEAAQKFSEKLYILVVKDCPDPSEKTPIDPFLSYDVQAVLYKKFNLNDNSTKVVKFYNELLQSICGGLKGIDLLQAREDLYKIAVNKLQLYLETKSDYMYRHSTDVEKISVGIYNELPEEYIELGCTEEKIQNASINHDIGKCLIDDCILKKETPLSNEEYDVMKTHVLEGIKILEPIMPKDELEMVYCHHERLDGSGYPRGLTEDQIAFGGKIFAVADSFNAAVSFRGYGEVKKTEDMFEELLSLSNAEYKNKPPKKNLFGRVIEAYHYDRVIVEAFIRYWGKSGVSQDAPSNDVTE
jgi:HD-GYP domain-containing protein (c-di-GMP phosphodiesterase class II)